jgi:hypothetical protein
MSITITGRQRSGFDSRRRPRRGASPRRLPNTAERGPRTLEELISSTIDQLASPGPASCPVCAQPRLTTAGCAGCGSHLS